VEPEPVNTPPLLGTPTMEVQPPESVVFSDCRNCNSLTHLVGQREGEIARLNLLLQLKESHISKMEKEMNALKMENSRLKKNISELNDGMRDLCVTAQNAVLQR